MMIRSRSQRMYALFAATLLLTVIGGVKGREVQAQSQTKVQQQSAASEPLVIQGRVTGIEGNLVTVKTPDGYPGGPGAHALFVSAGPTFKVDVSRARVLLPDGKQADKLPLAAGDRVLMVLNGPDSGSPAPEGPRNVNQTYFASIVERVVQSDKVVSH
jgi:hypothetical protein